MIAPLPLPPLLKLNTYAMTLIDLLQSVSSSVYSYSLSLSISLSYLYYVFSLFLLFCGVGVSFWRKLLGFLGSVLYDDFMGICSEFVGGG